MSAAEKRIQMMIGRAVLAAINDAPGIQELQLELLADETLDQVEHFQPYGLAVHPFKGAEAIMLSVGGLRSHGLAINVADRRYRLMGLQEGEVALYDDQGQKVHLTRDGVTISAKAITLESDGDIVLDATGRITGNCTDLDIAASGHAVITASGHAELEGATIAIGSGASLAAARNTDPINDTTDRISGGSAKVKIA